MLAYDSDQIVVTATRSIEQDASSTVSATLMDSAEIEHLGDPLVPALLRLAPSVAVTSQGPSGLITEVRIRGAENNHTLLFIDGIRANDPAAGDFARFELLNADLASRIEVVRGPQSALWGSQAIGGVIAVNGTDDQPGIAASAEAGSFGLVRSSGTAAVTSTEFTLSGAAGWQSASGIDSFKGGGDRDGYRNLSGRVRGTYQYSPSVKVGVAAFALSGRAEFDGYDPFTVERADTLDESRNRLKAGRIWTEFGREGSAWRGRLGASLLGSSNRNFLNDDETNRTKGDRRTIDAEIERSFTMGLIDQRLILVADTERESFHARDTAFGGFTNQDRTRSHHAATVEWIGSTKALKGDIAIRYDMFNRFKDATSLRASLQAELGAGLAVAGSYAEGIAQPTFFDLYGFFPGNFTGNPGVKPERSRGIEGSLRFRRPGFAASLTAYRQRLHDEIVDNATFTSVVNSQGVSRRWGIEAEFAWRPAPALRLGANYAYLEASQPNGALNEQLEELRRPRHSGSIVADGTAGRWSYGASITFVGSHLDRQEVSPFGVIRLESYWLANARLAYSAAPGIELFVRGSNLFDSNYQDSADYRTEGRGLFVGIRLADRRSSP